MRKRLVVMGPVDKNEGPASVGRQGWPARAWASVACSWSMTTEDMGVSSAWLLELQGHEVAVAFDGRPGAGSRPGLPTRGGVARCRPAGIDGSSSPGGCVPIGPEIRSVVVTAYARDNARRKASEAHFDHHFIKPVDLRGHRRPVGMIRPEEEVVYGVADHNGLRIGRAD